MKEDRVSEIYLDGRHYDLLFGDPSTDFWLDAIAKHGGPVLELGCGTGKITIPIAQSGYEITGIDLSEPMLAHARNKTDGMGLPIDFRFFDMTSFSLDRSYETIILPSNNLAHLTSIDDACSCFSRVHDHLKDDGAFIIDAFVPSIYILSKSPETLDVLSEYEDPDGGGKIIVSSKATYENDTQIRRVRTFQKMPSGDVIEGSLDMKMYFPQELEVLLSFCGFEVKEKFGGYDKSKFSTKSMKQLIVAQKKKTSNQSAHTTPASAPR